MEKRTQIPRNSCHNDVWMYLAISKLAMELGMTDAGQALEDIAQSRA